MSNSLRTKIFRFFVPLFLITTILIFGIIFIFLLSSLTNQDHMDLELKIAELKKIYQIGGLKALEEELEFNSLLQRDNPFYVRIADKKNQTYLSSVNKTWNDFQFSTLSKLSLNKSDSLHIVSSPNKDFEIEVMSKRLSDKYYIQVGGSTRIRKEILKHALTIFLTIIIPANLLLILWVGFFSSKLTKPINKMIVFLKEIINSNDYNKKFSSDANTTEIKELITIFNIMLEKTEGSILHLKSVLDSIAHDIRTPITKIRSVAELALDSSHNEHKSHEALAACIEECGNLINFTKSVLELAELEYGIINLKKHKSDIVLEIEEVVEVYHFIASDKHVNVEMRSPKQLYMQMDPARIKQAVSNLLDNAIKYSPENTKVNLEIKDDENWVYIIITDHGNGIVKSELNKIWKRQYSTGTKNKTKGSGLGLNIAKVFVEAHGGNIEIKASQGSGSCFIINLPKE